MSRIIIHFIRGPEWVLQDISTMTKTVKSQTLGQNKIDGQVGFKTVPDQDPQRIGRQAGRLASRQAGSKTARVYGV